MPIQCVLFDFDGVIMDSMQTFYRSLCHVCRSCNVSEPLYEKFLLEFDAPYTGYFQKLGIDLHNPHVEKIHYDSMILAYRGCKLFTEIGHIIPNLTKQGMTLGIVSANSHANIQGHLLQARIFSEFSLITISRYEKEECIRKTTDILGHEHNETLYVGDLPIDMREAKKVGVVPVGCVGTFEERRKLLMKAGARYCISHCGELPELIFRINKNQEALSL